MITISHTCYRESGLLVRGYEAEEPCFLSRPASPVPSTSAVFSLATWQRKRGRRQERRARSEGTGGLLEILHVDRDVIEACCLMAVQRAATHARRGAPSEQYITHGLCGASFGSSESLICHSAYAAIDPALSQRPRLWSSVGSVDSPSVHVYKGCEMRCETTLKPKQCCFASRPLVRLRQLQVVFDKALKLRHAEPKVIMSMYGLGQR